MKEQEENTIVIDNEMFETSEEKKTYIKEISELNKNKNKNINKQNKFMTYKIIAILILIFAEVFIIGGAIFKNSNANGDINNGSNKIAIINIDKAITSKYTDKIMQQMDEIYKDKDKRKWKEILLVINSGGGSPSASEELSEYLKYYTVNKLKVSVYIENIAASGAYYIASAIKPIKSNRNAIVGSIGVIMPHYNIGELGKKVGVEEDNVAYGEYKQPISLFKKVDKKSKDYLNKQLLKPAYDNFIGRVSENRGIKLSELQQYADGKIYIASMQEIKNILVDEITTKINIKLDYIETYGDNTTFIVIEEKKKIGLKSLLSNGFNIDLNIKLDENTRNLELR